MGILVAIVSRLKWSKGLVSLVGQRYLLLGLVISLSAVLGSLFYSEVAGYAPCVLCWWQRVFLYPVPILFAVAMYKKDHKVLQYVAPFVVIAGIIALYQSYVYVGGSSLLPCTAEEGDCSKIFVKSFGYITIPAMSLTVSLYLLLLIWIKKLYDKNRNT